MAAVVPVSGNNCVGAYADGTPHLKLKCLKNTSDNGDKLFTCSTMRYFKVSCPKLNQQCSSVSGAYVPAITVCTQRLF